ncbi:hypothetical protein CEXT_544321 [Caerostris extrusa]|uniref:C2H2-type domain-containing protein n=1 Tax=Caerostris extrusa TaxID=172846 RepID=A0AAV4QDA2_CAEEX|nr:hypothetical protein CEXT_544321 [Caerostris extrusa]
MTLITENRFSVVTIKFAQIWSLVELPPGCASCFSEFPCPGEGDAEDYAVIFVSIRLMKPLPFQNAQVVCRKGSSGRVLYNGGFYSPVIGPKFDFFKKITMMMMKLCNGSNEEWMKEVKHSGIAMTLITENRFSLVTIKFAEIRSPVELPPGCASCFSEFPCPERCGRLRSHLREHPADETASSSKRSGAKQKGTNRPGFI